MSVRQGDVNNTLEVFVELAIDLLAVRWDICKSSEPTTVAFPEESLHMIIGGLFAQAVMFKEVNDVLGAAISLKAINKVTAR
jgi:hypothetical protein